MSMTKCSKSYSCMCCAFCSAMWYNCVCVWWIKLLPAQNRRWRRKCMWLLRTFTIFACLFRVDKLPAFILEYSVYPWFVTTFSTKTWFADVFTTALSWSNRLECVSMSCFIQSLFDYAPYLRNHSSIESIGIHLSLRIYIINLKVLCVCVVVHFFFVFIPSQAPLNIIRVALFASHNHNVYIQPNAPK